MPTHTFHDFHSLSPELILLTTSQTADCAYIKCLAMQENAETLHFIPKTLQKKTDVFIHHNRKNKEMAIEDNTGESQCCFYRLRELNFFQNWTLPHDC